MTLTAAADGSALGNPGPAGWAWYIDDSNWRAGGWPHGTNNMGELQAVLDLLESTAELGEPLRVLCDSQYVINSITKWMKGWKRKGWKKGDGKPVLNIDLMKALDAAMEGRDVTFEWVKGHSGHELNEAADVRANAAARAHQAGREPEAGPGLALARASQAQERLTVASDEAAEASLPDARRAAPEPADDDAPGSAPGPGPGSAPDPDVDAVPAPGAAEGLEPEDLGDPDPDLLSALDDQADGLAAGSSPAQEVLALERRRLQSGLAPGGVHEEAVLIGADGRPADPESLEHGDPQADLHVVALLPLSPQAVQVIVHVLSGGGSAVHSALWTRQSSRNELGEWQLRHHQITVES